MARRDWYIRCMAKKPTAPDHKRVQIGVKLPPDVFDLIDAKRAEYPVPVTRTWVIEQAIRAYCDKGKRGGHTISRTTTGQATGGIENG